MAATILTVSQLDRVSGVNLTGTAAHATDGDAFPNTGKEFLLVTTGGTPTTVTIALSKTLDGQPVAPNTYSITTGGLVIGPFPTALYNNSSGRVVAVCSPITSVTVKAFRLVPEP